MQKINKTDKKCNTSGMQLKIDGGSAKQYTNEDFEYRERFSFYEWVSAISTGESSLYASILIKKEEIKK